MTKNQEWALEDQNKKLSNENGKLRDLLGKYEEKIKSIETINKLNQDKNEWKKQQSVINIKNIIEEQLHDKT